MEFADDDIHSIAESVWSAILGLDIRRSPDWTLAERDPGLLAGFVQITGAWEGAVVLYCPIALARRAAASMFEVAVDAASDAQTHDAIGELTNMTGGNLKALLPESCYLSLPTVISGAQAAVVPGGRLVARVAFECEGQPFLVTIFGRDAATAQSALI